MVNYSSLLSDQEYGKALDTLVVTCVDVVVIHNDKVLLVKRERYPIKGDWWIFGGRVLKGESLTKAAQRGILRELGIKIQNESRFKEIGVFSLIWSRRNEPLQESGCHHMLIAHAIEVTDEEFDRINTVSNQVEHREWFYFKPNKVFLPELNEVLSKSKVLLSSGE